MIIQATKFRTGTFMVLAFLAFSFTACETETTPELIDTEEFTDGAVYKILSHGVGKNHCLEFVFPVTIEFNDGTTADVESFANLKETVKAWLEENGLEPSRATKPVLVYPIQVINQEGEIIEVASSEELKSLAKECRRSKPGRRSGYGCFSLVYPVSVTIGDEVETFENRRTLKYAIRKYNKEEGDDAVRPELVFPVTIEMEDGTLVEVESREKLEEIKEDCKN